jgi:DNA-binding response OmpR family regulator
MGASAEVLPALALLQHQVKILPAEVSVLVDVPEVDCLFVDARRDLPNTKSFTKLISTTGVSSPIILITTEGGLSAINADWGVDDVILDTAGPAEIEARIRIALGNSAAELLASNPNAQEIRSGDVVIDERTYTAKLKGRVLDLTFKEFELLKYLAQHPGRVFTRSQLLQEIWGYDYFGGTRTVDVHIRRLRSKLGPEFEAIIGTVRNVGYRFSTSNDNATADLS